MAHALEELRLGGIGVLGALRGLGQALAVLPLAAHLLSHACVLLAAMHHANERDHGCADAQHDDAHADGHADDLVERNVNVDVVVARLAHRGQVEPGIGEHDRGFLRTQLALELIDDALVTRRRIVEIGADDGIVVRGDDRPAVLHDDGAAVGHVVTVEQALHGQLVTVREFLGRVVVGHDHARLVGAHGGRSVHVGGVRKNDAASVNLLRMIRHVQEGITLNGLRDVGRGNLVGGIFGKHLALRAHDDHAGQTQLACVLSQLFHGDIAAVLLDVSRKLGSVFEGPQGAFRLA